MKVIVSGEAAAAIFDEVRRWVEHGLQAAGVPLESMLYPLAAMVPATSETTTPLELARLRDIDELVIDGVAIPPDAVKSFSPHNCHFSAEDIDGANLEFNLAIDRMIHARPRLAVLSKLHAHPFEHGAFLSGGDLHHGVTSAKAVAWRRRRGLATALLHVVYPDGDPAPTDRPWRLFDGGARAGRVTWRIHSWGSTDRGMEDLGDAEIVSNRHPSVTAARRRPYWATRGGGRWCDEQKAALRGAGYRVSRNLLGRGWRRYLVDDRLGRQLVLALPPDLPRLAPRVLHVVDAMSNDFRPVPLPFPTPRRLPRLSLLGLLRALEAHQ